MKHFKVGDLVEWTVSTRARKTTKRGRIYAVVPANTKIETVLKVVTLARFRKASVRFTPRPRHTKSYLVWIDARTSARAQLHWPRRNSLRPDSKSLSDKTRANPVRKISKGSPRAQTRKERYIARRSLRGITHEDNGTGRARCNAGEDAVRIDNADWITVDEPKDRNKLCQACQQINHDLVRDAPQTKNTGFARLFTLGQPTDSPPHLVARDADGNLHTTCDGALVAQTVGTISNGLHFCTKPLQKELCRRCAKLARTDPTLIADASACNITLAEALERRRWQQPAWWALRQDA